MLAATESALCSFVITPTTSSARGTRPPFTTTAMPPPRRHIGRITSHDVVIARDREVGPGDVAERDAGAGPICDHDVALRAAVLGLAQELSEAHCSRQHQHVLHLVRCA
jgi:hypothetical protein